ncbi:MAG: hypothetical protein NWF11_04940 [Candidatus Bathyarchaeota archaeon]|nr:hypothetical protein [Candidatus Bathyarchaeota archaeon]
MKCILDCKQGPMQWHQSLSYFFSFMTFATAATIEEAKDLVATGLEHITEMDGIKIFRKCK